MTFLFLFLFYLGFKTSLSQMGFIRNWVVLVFDTDLISIKWFYLLYNVQDKIKLRH